MTTMDFFDAVSFTASIKSISEDGPGEFEAILSTPDVDREKESVMAGALTLPPSIPIYVDHDWRAGALPIGKAVPRYENGQIVVKGVYARHDRAQDVRQLVSDGIIDSMSVGFLNGKRTRDQKSGVTQVTAGEVFEGSFTGIPVNTGARVLASKAVTAVKAGARNASDDQQRLNEIHDLAVAAGANCMAQDTSKSIKAIVGTVEALQARVVDALEDAYGEWNTCLRGVDPAGTVYFDWFGGLGATYQQDFTDDGAVVTLTGEAVEVDIHEVVVPDADADRETDSGPTLLSVTPKSATTKAAGEAAAPEGAAADPAADEVEQVKARLRLLAVTV